MQIRLQHIISVTGILLVWGFLLVGCGPESTGADADLAQSETNSVLVEKEGHSDSMTSRGLPPAANARRMNFSLADQMPTLYQLIQENTDLVAEIEGYARKVILGEGLETSADLEAVFAFRDEEIIPHLTPVLENADQDIIDTNWKALSNELGTIGVGMTSAEGMFTGLAQAPMLSDKLEALASPAFRMYQEFQVANAETQSGEYPFNDMQPYGEMVRIGEQMKNKYPEDVYTQKVEERFMDALEYMTDVHLVRPGSGSKQQGPAMVFVGGTHVDAYPWMTENASREAFAKENAESRYSDIIQRILENPSEMGTESETLYVIVTDWAETQENARTRVYENLSDGKDIPHYLKIRRGDGTDKYAIAYRFFEDEEKANQAIEKIQQKIPEAQLIFCSVKGEKLYQLGI